MGGHALINMDLIWDVTMNMIGVFCDRSKLCRCGYFLLAAWSLLTIGFVLPALGQVGDAPFVYEPDPDLEGFHRVTLRGQESAPVYMADETLNLILDSQVPDSVRQALISQYPHFMLDLYENILETYYPDDADEYIGNPFPTWELPDEGVTMTQDPYAPNYVRVRVRDSNGRVEEFSLSRIAIDEILELEFDAGDFGPALAEYPYRLPEQARYSFHYLSREDLVAMIEEEPSMARQEFVRVKRVYMNPRPEDPDARPPLAEPVDVLELDGPVPGEHERSGVLPSPEASQLPRDPDIEPIMLAEHPPEDSDQTRSNRYIVLFICIAVAIILFAIGRIIGRGEMRLVI